MVIMGVDMALPHSEEVLASLVNVHIVGGTVDLSAHLEGAKMRPKVVLGLINKLRASGYPGYDTASNTEEAAPATNLAGGVSE